MGHGGWDQPDRPAPRLVRRLVPAVVIALLLGGGTTLLVRYATSDRHPIAAPSPTVSATTDPPYVPVVVEPSPSPSPSASPTRSPQPTRPRPTPSRSVPRTPSPSPSRVPVYLQPQKGLCRYIDFAPMTVIDTIDPKHDTPEVIDKIKPGDPPGSNWYLCQGGVGNVGMRWVGVEVYPDRASAALRYVQEKSTEAPAGMDPVYGLGDDAYGFYLGASTIYKVVVLRSNLFVIVDLQVPYPDAASFKKATVETARSIVHNVPVKP